MLRRPALLFFMILVLFASGCVKETYDMNRLSQRMKYSPTLAMAVIKGDVSFTDIVKASDTIIFDQDNFVRIVFKEDSIIELKLEDFFDLSDMVSFTHNYELGELSIDPFYNTINLTLDQISQQFSSVLRAQFVALDHTTSNFPSFPSVDMGSSNMFPSITTFEHATFASGVIEISIKNNLPAPLYGMTISLFNTADLSPIGSEKTISSIQPGSLGITSIDLTDENVTKDISAEIVLTGSPGTGSPVYIDLAGSDVEIGIRGKDLKIKSGRVIIPLQTLSTVDDKDTIDFDPGSGIELVKFGITEGVFNYVIESASQVDATVELTLPDVVRSGIPLTESLIIDPNSTNNGTISVDNTIFDLGTDTEKPYNKVPMEYIFEVSSSGMVDFDMTNFITMNFTLTDPDFDYVKGYFGQELEAIDTYDMNLELEDMLSKISGDILISSPSIKLNYSNSFAVPMEIELNASGTRGSESEDLNFDPFSVEFPDAPLIRDVESSVTIDKNNSSLPELVSLPPEQISFTGSAQTNPAGNNGDRDNYVFGNSRFIGSLEVEVPMEFQINNLQFADTLENFLKSDSEEDDSFSLADFESLKVDISVKNGFPLGVSLQMSLYDSLTQTIKSTIDATNIIEPALVDGNGKVTETKDTKTSLEFSQDFFDAIDNADQIIFIFTLNTTSTNGVFDDVKIYSDYRIDFTAALVVKPDFNLK